MARTRKQVDAVDPAVHSSVGPPSSIAAERYLLGALLRDNTVLEDLHFLNPEDFYSAAYQRLFAAVRNLEGRGLPIEMVALIEVLGTTGIEEIGGAAAIAGLFTDVPAPVNVPYYAKLVKDKAGLRGIVRACRHAIDGAYVEEAEAGALSAHLEQELFQLSHHGHSESLKPVQSLIAPVIQEITDRYNTKSPVSGIPTGYTDLDRRINGLRPTDLIIVAGRPGMGKTSLVLNMAENMIFRDNPATVIVFSLEMSSEQLLYRMLSSRARIDSGALQRGFFSQEEWREVLNTADELRDAPLYIDDDPVVSVEQIHSKTRHLINRINRVTKTEVQLGAVVVDYLQLMIGKNQERREREIGEISRGLKIMAKQLHVPVIALSQLNRSLESRVDKRPMLSDLRESGSIEQDADLILFIYRDALYKRSKEGEEPTQDAVAQDNTAEIIIGKNRHGPTGKIELNFEGRFTRFYSKAREDYAAGE